MSTDRLYFHLLTHDEQKAAIVRLAESGMRDTGIASATGLAVEQVREIIGERGGNCQGCDE